MRNGDSILTLVKDLKQETKTFIREEIQLAKTEMSEKLSAVGGKAMSIAIGGFVAYAGLILFLGGLGALLAFVFHNMGLDPLLAGFIGLGIIGFAVIGAGVVMLMTGLGALKKASIAPERTIETLQYLKGRKAVELGAMAREEKPQEKRTSKQIEASVLKTENRMAATLEELADRVTLKHMRQKARAEVQTHPYRWGLVAAGCGAAGS